MYQSDHEVPKNTSRTMADGISNCRSEYSKYLHQFVGAQAAVVVFLICFGGRKFGWTWF